MKKEIEVTRQTLTKRFFMSLVDGKYLVSNVCHPNREPVFADRVVSSSKREQQWEQILNASVAQRMCWIFENKKDYKNFWSKLTEKK